MSAEALAVTFANRRQMLKAVLTLPDELGLNINYWQGAVEFIKKGEPDQDSPPTQHFMYYNFDGLEGFIPHPNEARHVRKSIKPSQILLRLGIPNRVIVGIDTTQTGIEDNSRVIELFRRDFLPLLRKYQVDYAWYEEIVGSSKQMRIPTMALMVREGKSYEHRHHAACLEEPFSVAIERGSIAGWFRKILDVNGGRFIYRDEDISRVALPW